MIHEFKRPIPVLTEHGKGYVWFVRNGGNWENDIFCIILCDGGKVRFYTNRQFTIERNETFEIKSHEIKKTNTKEKGSRKNY